MPSLNLSSLSSSEKLRYLELLKEQDRRRRLNQIATLFPDEGPLRRELYKRHMEFFNAGAEHRERLFLAGNRVGKTIAGGYETTLHLTGRYPHWWEGRRFDEPVKWLAAGDTLDTTKDIILSKMMGDDENQWGTGLIPGNAIAGFDRWEGKKGMLRRILVKHISGGTSQLMLRSYDQGRRIFQGFELHGAWLDEEVPSEVYEEALTRTMTTDGVILLTFTPLQGITPLVQSWLEGAGLL